MREISAKKVVTYAGALVGYMMGSAFATGQEIFQFFAAYGLWGAIGAASITGVAVIFLAAVIMEDARTLNLKRPSDLFKYYCGKHVGIAIEIITIVYLYSLFIVMVAGGGTILNEHYGLERWVGSLSIAILALSATLCGLKNIMSILGKIGPLNIIVVVSVSILVLIIYGDQLGNADEFLATRDPLKAAKYWWVSGILYPANCTIFMVTFLAAMGTTASNRKEAMLGGIAGGLLFTMGIFLVSLGLVATMPQIFNLQTPAIGMSTLVYPGFGVIYSVTVVLATLASSIPLLWAPVISIAPDEKSSKFRIFAVIGVVVALIVSQIDFSKLINIIIPLAGWLGLIVPISILIKHMKIRIPGYNTAYNKSDDFDSPSP